MADGSLAQAFQDRNAEARALADATPLDQFHVADSKLFRSDTLWPWFERLRAEDPVHYTAESEYGPYWSVTKHRDIVAVDSNHAVFSSCSTNGGIAIDDGYGPKETSNFIALDPPMHDDQRKVVAPMFTSASIWLVSSIATLSTKSNASPRGSSSRIFAARSRMIGSSQMLATLMDYPFEERRKLTRCSDLILARPEPGGIVDSEEQRQIELLQILTPFTAMWDERRAAAPRNDILSMLAHGEATYRDNPQAYMGNIILMIVAGSDTTRHSITGGLLALNQNPDEYAKLRADPALIDSLVPEVIRWQSPVAHMRRSAVEDAEIGGKPIKKGDKVVMWYVSGNRDGDVIPDPDRFVIDRERPRTHVGFGFGIHRCVGNRLAEMQLRVMWEEILKRFPFIEVTGEPRRMNSNFVKGYEAMPVRIPA